MEAEQIIDFLTVAASISLLTSPIFAAFAIAGWRMAYLKAQDCRAAEASSDRLTRRLADVDAIRALKTPERGYSYEIGSGEPID